jgi:hypothetical protein
MLDGQKPALFVIVGHTPEGDFTVPIVSARAAAQVVRHLTEYCPQTRATWQVHPHAVPSPVVVFGCARPSVGEYLPDQDAHAFLLAAGDPLPSVWVALCGRQVAGARFEALDRGMGRPCQDCHQRRTTAQHQHAGLPVRVPGQHLHPQLRCPLLTSRLSQGGSKT